MEFLSPKTKEHIEKLEREKAQLAQELEQLSKAQPRKSALLPWYLTFLLAIALVFTQWFSSKSSTNDLASIQVELWRNGNAVDTLLTVNDDLKYSIQVGAYQSLNISDISYGFKEFNIRGSGEIKHVVLGEYTSLPDAQAFLETVINLGFENAFIVAFKGENAVGLLSNKTANN
jgi:hypothetical protein